MQYQSLHLQAAVSVADSIYESVQSRRNGQRNLTSANSSEPKIGAGSAGV